MKNKITKEDLVEELQYSLVMTPQSAEGGVNCLIEKIRLSLLQGKTVEIEGLGYFHTSLINGEKKIILDLEEK